MPSIIGSKNCIKYKKTYFVEHKNSNNKYASHIYLYVYMHIYIYIYTYIYILIQGDKNIIDIINI